MSRKSERGRKEKKFFEYDAPPAATGSEDPMGVGGSFSDGADDDYVDETRMTAKRKRGRTSSKKSHSTSNPEAKVHNGDHEVWGQVYALLSDVDVVGVEGAVRTSRPLEIDPHKLLIVLRAFKDGSIYGWTHTGMNGCERIFKEGFSNDVDLKSAIKKDILSSAYFSLIPTGVEVLEPQIRANSSLLQLLNSPMTTAQDRIALLELVNSPGVRIFISDNLREAFCSEDKVCSDSTVVVAHCEREGKDPCWMPGSKTGEALLACVRSRILTEVSVAWNRNFGSCKRSVQGAAKNNDATHRCIICPPHLRYSKANVMTSDLVTSALLRATAAVSVRASAINFSGAALPAPPVCTSGAVMQVRKVSHLSNLMRPLTIIPITMQLLPENAPRLEVAQSVLSLLNVQLEIEGEKRGDKDATAHQQSMKQVLAKAKVAIADTSKDPLAFLNNMLRETVDSNGTVVPAEFRLGSFHGHENFTSHTAGHKLVQTRSDLAAIQLQKSSATSPEERSAVLTTERRLEQALRGLNHCSEGGTESWTGTSKGMTVEDLLLDRDAKVAALGVAVDATDNTDLWNPFIVASCAADVTLQEVEQARKWQGDGAREKLSTSTLPLQQFLLGKMVGTKWAEVARFPAEVVKDGGVDVVNVPPLLVPGASKKVPRCRLNKYLCDDTAHTILDRMALRDANVENMQDGNGRPTNFEVDGVRHWLWRL